jgi:hypothetical protein
MVVRSFVSSRIGKAFSWTGFTSASGIGCQEAAMVIGRQPTLDLPHTPPSGHMKAGKEHTRFLLVALKAGIMNFAAKPRLAETGSAKLVTGTVQRYSTPNQRFRWSKVSFPTIVTARSGSICIKANKNLILTTVPTDQPVSVSSRSEILIVAKFENVSQMA